MTIVWCSAELTVDSQNADHAAESAGMNILLSPALHAAEETKASSVAEYSENSDKIVRIIKCSMMACIHNSLLISALEIHLLFLLSLQVK
jgi:hypothetical protein